MSNYKHGIYISQSATVTPVSNKATGSIQAVVGVAPINLISNPAGAVNKPILLSSIDDVAEYIGYSTDVNKFTLMQAVHATFEIFSTAPIIAINVLDPSKHATAKTSSASLSGGVLTIEDTGVLLSTLKLTSSDGTVTYVSGTDYTAAFNSDGTVLVTRVSSSTALTATSTISIGYSILDTTKVTDADIVAGIAVINKAFQITGVVPEILLAPGYSQNKVVSSALITAAQSVSCVFEATALVDIDAKANTTIDAAIAVKSTNSLAVRDAILCYPKVTTSQGKTVYMSAQLGALMQYVDSQNESTPFVSPSNKDFKIIAAVLDDTDKTQILYTLDEANRLNGEGIFTAINFDGWKSWGNNTGIYSLTAVDVGETIDVKDRYINIKRAFDWQNNGFIRRYFSKIDSPLNLKAIQTLITDENQYYNAFIAVGYVAGMSITYNQADNPTSQILNGTIKFKQSITPYTPMEVVENTLQFDPTTLETALEGSAN